MSAPTIEQAIVLPTLLLSLRVRPPAGVVATDYTVAIDGTPIAGLPFSEHDGRHFLARVGALTRGQTYSVAVMAESAGGPSQESAAVSVTATPGASRAETVRQRIGDLIDAAALQVHGLDVSLFADHYGQPDVIVDGTPIARRIAAVVELGTALSDDQDEAHDQRVDTVTVPVRVIGLGTDRALAGDVALRAAELIRRTLNVTGNHCLNLNRFGVVPGSVVVGRTGAPEVSPDGQAAAVRFEVTAPVRYIAAAELL